MFRVSQHPSSGALKTVSATSGVGHTVKYKLINIVKDSTALTNDLTKMKLDENHRMITLDNKDLYVNIPIQETLRIAKTLLLENNNEHTTKQMITLLEVTLQQNYFSFCNNIYQPEKGVSMGSPISNTVAEIFLQDL